MLIDVSVVLAYDDSDVRLRMQWHGRIIRLRSGWVVPLLNRKRFPIVAIGVKNIGCRCENTLLEQCEVEDVFRIQSLALRLVFVIALDRPHPEPYARCALRAVCGGVLDYVLVVFPC